MTKLLSLIICASIGCGGTAKTVNNSGGASGSARVEWRVKQLAYPKVEVTLVFAGQPHVLGPLDATADGPEDGKLAACGLMPPAAGVSELACGGTPHNNSFRARLAGGQLVVTLEESVDSGEGPPTDVSSKPVASFPMTAATLEIAPFDAPCSEGMKRVDGHCQG